MRHWYSHFHPHLAQTGWLLKHHLWKNIIKSAEVFIIICQYIIILCECVISLLSLYYALPHCFIWQQKMQLDAENIVCKDWIKYRLEEEVIMYHCTHTLQNRGCYIIHIRLTASCNMLVTLSAHHTSVSHEGMGLKWPQSAAHPWPAHKRQWKMEKLDRFRNLH